MIDKLYKAFKNSAGISIDTRSLRAGEMFFALSGENFNGNAFALTALGGGASYVVVSDPEIVGSDPEIVGDKVILVEDCLAALQELALHHRNHLDIPIIAITGSNGKTTTKELVSQVLSVKFKTVATRGNLNNHIGVPLSLLTITEQTEIAVIEMGANHIGEIRFLCALARPTHGLITNIGKAHLEGFGSLDGVKEAKSELYESLKSSNGVVFVNLSTDYLDELSSDIPVRVKYAIEDVASTDNTDYVFTEDISSDGLCVVWHTAEGNKHAFESALYGAYNLPNIATAITLGLYFGVRVEDISSALKSYTAANNRSQIIQKGDKTILLDAYNANPVSMELAVSDMAQRRERKSLILGGMNELGDHADAEHMKLLKQVSQFEWGEVILIGSHFAELQRDFDFLWFADVNACRQYLEEHTLTGEVVLLKGSRSLQLELLLDDIK